MKKEKIKSQEAELTMEALRERLEELKDEEFILSIFYRLILEVGLLAIGLIYVILGIGLVNYLIQRNWLQVGIILGIGAIAFVGSMFAQILATGLEALSGKFVEFVFT